MSWHPAPKQGECQTWFQVWLKYNYPSNHQSPLNRSSWMEGQVSTSILASWAAHAHNPFPDVHAGRKHQHGTTHAQLTETQSFTSEMRMSAGVATWRPDKIEWKPSVASEATIGYLDRVALLAGWSTIHSRGNKEAIALQNVYLYEIWADNTCRKHLQVTPKGGSFRKCPKVEKFL